LEPPFLLSAVANRRTLEKIRYEREICGEGRTRLAARAGPGDIEPNDAEEGIEELHRLPSL
jgi:hypothetical protein